MEVGFTTTEPLDLKVDALVLPHFDQEPFGPFLVRIDEALGGELSGVVRTGDASPSLAGRMVLPTLGRIRTPRILLMGLGRRAELDPYRLRNAYEIAGRKLKGGARRLGVVVEPGLLAALGGDGAAAVRAVVTGIAMGNCETDEWRADSPRPGAIESVQILGIPDNGPTLAEVARKAEIVAAFANRCRTWQWQPSNFLTPTQMGREAAEMAKEVGLECTVLEKPELEALGMGLLLGVARGSHEPPCVVVLRYRPKHEDAGAPTLGLVGKGITFDSGGTSLKPATRMGLMKADMSGGASVVAAMGAISLLKAPISVIGVVPLTENMPGGAALKPGDIIRALDGRSVEIINTDA